MALRSPFLFLLLILACTCTRMAWAKPTVVVSIPPQKTFVEAIAGDSVEVITLVKPGQNPENFSITPRTLAQVSSADIYFTLGVPMELALLPRIQANYQHIQIVDSAAGIRKRQLEDHHHENEEAGGAHLHSEDPHTWLSPGLVKIQLRHYSRSLKNLLPDQSGKFDTNQAAFLKRLEEVDTYLQELLVPLKGATVFVYHPAFGYFLERYGLRQQAVELQGKQPSAGQLSFLIKLAREHEARVIFVQPQFNRHSAQAVAKAIGGTVETIDPLAENYLDNLLHMGETIAKSY